MTRAREIAEKHSNWGGRSHGDIVEMVCEDPTSVCHFIEAAVVDALKEAAWAVENAPLSRDRDGHEDAVSTLNVAAELVREMIGP